MNKSLPSTPKKIFSTFSAVAVIIGIVVGIGIFRLPSIVAQNSASEWHYIAYWLAGGFISITGALCYAELASKYPDAGGEYHFLTKAYGPGVGFLFSWGRMTVIQTGSIALAAFILGDYATLIYDFGSHSPAIYAGLTVILLTALNIMGTSPAKNVQTVMTGTIFAILVGAGILGLLSGMEFTSAESSLDPDSETSLGGAMIFVLLTYGGWTEGVYLSAEIKDVRKKMITILVVGLSAITFAYVLINGAYLHVLGLEQLSSSETIGVDLIDKLIGTKSSLIMAVIVIVSALSTANATIITGARTNYALGRDFKLLNPLGKWNKTYNAPINALLLQGGIAFFLVLLGAVTQQAVETMVDYTAPVFWFFILLTTTTLFIFRNRSLNDKDTGFDVPFYPFTPILFILACLYLLYSSIMFTGSGSLLGIAILAVGLPIYFWAKARQK